MKNAIIIHGKPSKEGYYGDGDSESNSHWIPWLQQQLIKASYLPQAPEMPEPYNPVYENWRQELERYDLNEETLLVGHSCGGGFLVRYLSENPDVKVGKVVLVAPWIDLEKSLDTGMFSFKINPKIADRTKELIFFSSDDDHEAVQNSVKKLLSSIDNVKHKTFHRYGHFCLKDMKTREFPELLKALSQD